MATFGETTSRRLGGVIAKANAGGAGPGDGGKRRVGAGGGGGGAFLGGATFGKAATGRLAAVPETNANKAAAAYGPGIASGAPTKRALSAKRNFGAPGLGGAKFSQANRFGGGHAGSPSKPNATRPGSAKLNATTAGATRPASRGGAAASLWPEEKPVRRFIEAPQPRRAALASSSRPASARPDNRYTAPAATSRPPRTLSAHATTRRAGATTAPQQHPGEVASTVPHEAPDDASSVGGDEGQVVTQAHIFQLEEELRGALKEHRSIHELERDMLMRIFRDVDDGSGEVDENEFRKICKRSPPRGLGIPVSRQEVSAIFAKLGYAGRSMPYDVFAMHLLARQSRQLASDAPVRKGTFVIGESTNFHGKVLYPQCRKPVYTPSDWNPSLAERSGQVPDAELHLEFVYGYGGLSNGMNNLHHIAGDGSEVVYYAAGVGIVYNKNTHQQRFFLGHTNDIHCLDVCKAAITYQDEEFPARSLVATGQACTPDDDPSVSIWDARKGSQTHPDSIEVARLALDRACRSVNVCQFSPDGKYLVAVGTDNSHTVHVFDWRRGELLATGNGYQADPCKVYGCVWNPYNTTRGEFVTYGHDHAKLWREGDGRKWSGTKMRFGGKVGLQSITSACFLPPVDYEESNAVATGTAKGQIYVWRDGNAIRSINAHRTGAPVILPDGVQSFGGVRALQLTADGKAMLSGGADGMVHRWDVTRELTEKCRMDTTVHSVLLESPYKNETPPSIRALDMLPGGDGFVIGTNRCDVWEVSKGDDSAWAMEVLIYGHTADLYGLCWHPALPTVFATAAESSRVFIWDAEDRVVLATCGVGFACRSVAFSPNRIDAGDGSPTHHLAVGGKAGRLRVLAVQLGEQTTVKPMFDAKDCTQAIDDIKYSPTSKYLAVASHDTCIDIYSVRRGYQHMHRCNGHSATVSHLDWSADGSILQSNCNAHEILYWDPKTGKQIAANQRDQEWNSWTLTLGFGVMGIWPDYSDGSDINALHRNHGKDLVATADDFGLVKLFNYPCVCEDSPYRGYRGHSSHVMNVRWSPTDRWVTSVGGYDRCVFQFTFSRLEPPPPPPVVKTVWSAIDDSGKYMGFTDVVDGEEDQVGQVGHLPSVAESISIDDDGDDDGEDIF